MDARRVPLLAAAAGLALASGGCATQQAAPVNVVADSYCQAARKRTWSVNDTPETIQEAVRHNAGLDRACGYPGKARATS